MVLGTIHLVCDGYFRCVYGIIGANVQRGLMGTTALVSNHLLLVNCSHTATHTAPKSSGRQDPD
jgi:hypothetical protein